MKERKIGTAVVCAVCEFLIVSAFFAKIIGTRFDASPAQVATAWAIAKGTLPIIGVTKVRQVEEAAKAVQIELTDDEISRLERLGDETGVHTLREWKKEM